MIYSTKGAMEGLGASSGAKPSVSTDVIGLAIQGITLAIGAWLNRKGPKQKVATTEIVNEAEPLLLQNLNAFNAGRHTSLDQQQALSNFDQIWGMVVQKCSDPANGTPGQNCVRERQRGSGTGYDWFALYRDPIANAQIHDTPIQSVESVASQVFGGDFASLDSFASGLDVKSMILPLVLIGGIWYLSNKV